MERKEEKIPQEVSPTNRKGGKKITSAVLKANRRNPRKIGLFAKELILTDEEKAEFQALSRALRVQLQPSTTLQYIGLDRIVCCCWRCKLALRREMQRFEMSSNLQVQSEGTSDPNTTARWYTAGRQELNSEIRWLETIKGDFENSGVVRAELEATHGYRVRPPVLRIANEVDADEFSGNSCGEEPGHARQDVWNGRCVPRRRRILQANARSQSRLRDGQEVD
jgi:hypothetical protein